MFEDGGIEFKGREKGSRNHGVREDSRRSRRKDMMMIAMEEEIEEI